MTKKKVIYYVFVIRDTILIHKFDDDQETRRSIKEQKNERYKRIFKSLDKAKIYALGLEHARSERVKYYIRNWK